MRYLIQCRNVTLAGCCLRDQRVALLVRLSESEEVAQTQVVARRRAASQGAENDGAALRKLC